MRFVLNISVKYIQLIEKLKANIGHNRESFKDLKGFEGAQNTDTRVERFFEKNIKIYVVFCHIFDHNFVH